MGGKHYAVPVVRVLLVVLQFRACPGYRPGLLLQLLQPDLAAPVHRQYRAGRRDLSLPANFRIANYINANTPKEKFYATINIFLHFYNIFYLWCIFKA